MFRKVVIPAALAAAVIALPTAQASAHDGLALGLLGGAIVGATAAILATQPSEPVYAAPAPVYVQPAPVYVQPAPVYVQPAPVYVQPAPVYAAPYPYYGYRYGWR
jgi:hypothetical protein